MKFTRLFSTLPKPLTLSPRMKPTENILLSSSSLSLSTYPSESNDLKGEYRGLSVLGSLFSYIVFAVLTLTIAINQVAAQSPDPTPSPTPQVSPSPSPSATPTPSPTPSATPSPSPASPSTNQSAGGPGGSVLGETTALGETDSGREFVKWVIAVIGGLLTFLVALRIVRNDTQE